MQAIVQLESVIGALGIAIGVLFSFILLGTAIGVLNDMRGAIAGAVTVGTRPGIC